MTALTIKQLPIKVRASHKADVRTQFAALCYRFSNNRTEVLLITTRRTGRWILPKGWPMDGMTPAASALQEAWEEAGVVGKGYDRCLGLFSYNKILDQTQTLPCVAMVYPVKVKSLAPRYPEFGQRRRKWFGLKKASQRVMEPELARIIRDFDPKALR
ncbi:NUDIX hydrolase [Thalassococcus sp. S3]|uniref:NUDIX hydrolase n=1 Tax=Thalassococcus sp. S3 TaxID=2017482 RepID=UPI0020C383E2|nr:NUDIX hydrolase [Thalassococcus sp. S3]